MTVDPTWERSHAVKKIVRDERRPFPAGTPPGEVAQSAQKSQKGEQKPRTPTERAHSAHQRRQKSLPCASQVGSYNNIVVQASDLGGISTKTYTLAAVVPGPDTPPLINSIPPGPAVYGQQYQYQVTATDPAGD